MCIDKARMLVDDSFSELMHNKVLKVHLKQRNKMY